MPFFFPLHQPGSPPSRAYEAPTPGSGWASTPGGNYAEAGTPNSAAAYRNAYKTFFFSSCLKTALEQSIYYSKVGSQVSTWFLQSILF